MSEERDDRDSIFVTVSMAEILLSQNLVSETRKVVTDLKERAGSSSAVAALEKRVEEISSAADSGPQALPGRGSDRVELDSKDGALVLTWEVTEESLRTARLAARYSGIEILRLFTAAPGPRGVRTSVRDIEIEHRSARQVLRGLPPKAVHVAAVGFLANTGVFVPLAESSPLAVTP